MASWYLGVKIYFYVIPFKYYLDGFLNKIYFYIAWGKLDKLSNSQLMMKL